MIKQLLMTVSITLLCKDVLQKVCQRLYFNGNGRQPAVNEKMNYSQTISNGMVYLTVNPNMYIYMQQFMLCFTRLTYLV